MTVPMPIRRALFGALFLAALAPPPSHAAGVGQACGGPSSIACDNGLLCDSAVGSCGSAHAPGTCVIVGTICSAIYLPVCGCDHKTYGNDCERRARRVSKAHDGPC